MCSEDRLLPIFHEVARKKEMYFEGCGGLLYNNKEAGKTNTAFGL